MERGFKGVFIHADLYLNEELSWTEKILLTEIYYLDHGDGCFASNEYLGKFIRVSEQQCADLVSGLRKAGYIEDVRFDGRRRWISVTPKAAFGFSRKQSTVFPEDSNILSNKDTAESSEIGISPSQPPRTELEDDEDIVLVEVDSDGEVRQDRGWGKKAPPKPKDDGNEVFLKQIEKVYGKRFLARAKQYRALNTMRANGVNVSEIEDCIDEPAEEPNDPVRLPAVLAKR